MAGRHAISEGVKAARRARYIEVREALGGGRSMRAFAKEIGLPAATYRRCEEHGADPGYEELCRRYARSTRARELGVTAEDVAAYIQSGRGRPPRTWGDGPASPAPQPPAVPVRVESLSRENSAVIGAAVPRAAVITTPSVDLAPYNETVDVMLGWALDAATRTLRGEVVNPVEGAQAILAWARARKDAAKKLADQNGSDSGSDPRSILLKEIEDAPARDPEGIVLVGPWADDSVLAGDRPPSRAAAH